MVDKEKEILELRKLYISSQERFDARIYFLLLAFSIALMISPFKEGVPYLIAIIGLILFLTITGAVEGTFDKWRKKSFNKLIKEVRSGKLNNLE